jgi:DNA-binding NarL/FixJ family response regulator
MALIPLIDQQDTILPAPLLIVEDEPAMRWRLFSILTTLGYGESCVHFADSIAAAHAVLAQRPFAMALIDVGLPDGSGIDLIRTLHGRDPALPILVISAWSAESVIVTALQSGATGYLLKERDDLEIALSIRSVFRGGAPIDPFVARRILELIGVQTQPPASGLDLKTAAPAARPLSPREIEILGLVSKGLTNREIADLLSLSRLTVECHIKNIYKKLAVSSRTQAVFEARTSGLLP